MTRTTILVDIYTQDVPFTFAIHRCGPSVDGRARSHGVIETRRCAIGGPGDDTAVVADDAAPSEFLGTVQSLLIV